MRDNNFFYLTRPLLLGEAPHPLLNILASPKSFTLGNDQMHCNCSMNPVIADSIKLCTFAARPIAY